MRKLIYSIYKEFYLLKRDKAALATLFLMPVLLVFVITFLQDNTISQLQKSKISIIFINNDKGELAQSIEDGLNQTEYFQLDSLYEGHLISDSLAYKLVAKGDYKVFIKLPVGMSNALDQNAANLYKLKVSPIVQDSEDAKRLGKNISVFFDPTIQKLFKTSVLDALEKSIEKVKSKILLKTFSQEILNDVYQLSGGMIAMGKDSINLTQDDLDLVKIDQQYAHKDKMIVMPNSVQHNVPAWSMFAMFFIALPLAGNMIKERDSGSLKRLLSMPISYSTILSAKILIYIAIAFIQFVLMMLVGLIFLPLLGTPVLNLGDTYFGLFLLVISSALAATGFGILVGVTASSHEQASAFSSVCIIIAAAIGGVMVPVYLMPTTMQDISVYSPLAWGLNGFLDIFVRGDDFWSVLPNVFRLLLFSMTALVISSFLFKFKNRKI